MAALENTLKMGTWMFLLLGFFLVPRCHCDTSAVNKTGLLLDELDSLLVQVTQDHVDMYVNSRKCLSSSSALQENCRSNQNGIILLLYVLYRYNLLTQMYNYGCKKRDNENLSSIAPICEPFGCHKLEMRSMSDQLLPSDSNMVPRSDYFNINNITIVLTMPTEKPKDISAEEIIIIEESDEDLFTPRKRKRKRIYFPICQSLYGLDYIQ